jgi:hypothetical protein
VVGRDHHHHAERGEQHQQVELALGPGRALEVGAAVDQHDRDRQIEEQLEDVANQVATNMLLKVGPVARW